MQECKSEHIIQTKLIGPSQLFVSHCEATKASSPPEIHAEAELPIINRAAEDKAGAIIEPVGRHYQLARPTSNTNHVAAHSSPVLHLQGVESFPLGVRDFHLKP